MERSKGGARVGQNQKMSVTEYVFVFKLSLGPSLPVGFLGAESALFLEEGTVPTTTSRQEI